MKRILLLLGIAALVNTYSIATNLPKVIAGNETWTAANSPYVLTDNLSILSGASVKVMPGVEIRSNGSFNISVSGKFECLGKADSMILVNKTIIAFGTSAVDYDSISKTGSRFIYTDFNQTTAGSYLLTTQRCNLFFDHCIFEGGYYGIYNLSDSIKLWIYNSKFIGSNTSYYVISGLYTNSYLDFEDNTILKSGYFYLAERNVIKRNYFQGGTYSYGLAIQSYTREAEISCNTMKNQYYGIYATSLSPKIRKMYIHDNWFDSCGYVAYIYGAPPSADSLHLYHNNFTLYNKSIYFSSSASSGKIMPFSVADNYWGTTDTTVFKGTVYDNRNSSTILYRVNLNGLLANPVSGCWPTSPSNLSGLEDGLSAPVFSYFPNPASASIRVHTEKTGIYSLTLSSMQGQTVYSDQINGNDTEIALNHLSSGVYFMMLQNQSGARKIEKLLVQH